MKTAIRARLTWLGDCFKENIEVVIEGNAIVDVRESLAAGNHDVDNIMRLDDQALIPGFVNCHSHSFQIALRGLGEDYTTQSRDSFWTWRTEMYRLVESIKHKEQLYDAAYQCFEEMKRSGITSVGEFHYFHHGDIKEDEATRFMFDSVIVRAAEDVGIRLVLLMTYYGFAGFAEKPLDSIQRRFESRNVEEFFEQVDKLIDLAKDNGSLCTIGIAAHSLRAVTPCILKELHEGAKKRSVPFHLHLEEQVKEVEDCMAFHQGRTPMRVLLDSTKVDHLTTAVHCNHSEKMELEEFVTAGGNVCACPLTEGNLGDGIMTNFKECATNICLGTDCNARIDFLEEMRWLEYGQRLYTMSRGVCAKNAANFPGQINKEIRSSGTELLRIATENGANSLGLKVGKIQKGYLADFASIDLTARVFRGQPVDTIANSLLNAMIFGASASEIVKEVCVNGKWSRNNDHIA